MSEAQLDPPTILDALIPGTLVTLREALALAWTIRQEDFGPLSKTDFVSEAWEAIEELDKRRRRDAR